MASYAKELSITPTNRPHTRSFSLNPADAGVGEWMVNKGTTVAALLTAFCLSGSSVCAQDASDEDIKLFRTDVRSLKKQIIGANMGLSEDETQKFWPIYDQYAAELAAINDTKFALLSE